MKVFQANDDSKFISVKLQLFCKKRGIAIRYTTPYIYKENRMTERD